MSLKRDALKEIYKNQFLGKSRGLSREELYHTRAAETRLELMKSGELVNHTETAIWNGAMNTQTNFLQTKWRNIPFKQQKEVLRRICSSHDDFPLSANQKREMADICLGIENNQSNDDDTDGDSVISEEESLMELLSDDDDDADDGVGDKTVVDDEEEKEEEESDANDSFSVGEESSSGERVSDDDDEEEDSDGKPFCMFCCDCLLCFFFYYVLITLAFVLSLSLSPLPYFYYHYQTKIKTTPARVVIVMQVKRVGTRTHVPAVLTVAVTPGLFLPFVLALVTVVVLWQ